jgi:hypothetical protein
VFTTVLTGTYPEPDQSNPYFQSHISEIHSLSHFGLPKKPHPSCLYTRYKEIICTNKRSFPQPRYVIMHVTRLHKLNKFASPIHERWSGTDKTKRIRPLPTNTTFTTFLNYISRALYHLCIKRNHNWELMPTCYPHISSFSSSEGGQYNYVWGVYKYMQISHITLILAWYWYTQTPTLHERIDLKVT